MANTENNIIAQKTRELCEAIVKQPEFQNLRQKVDTFLNDNSARQEYQFLSEQGEFLQHKQRQGMALTEAEISEFEQKREAFLSNPVARGFLDAQEEMQEVQQTVSKYVHKTFELGRLPEAEDFEGGCGSGGCGCH
jgi:cell fate (sporulation/competence/biofilm development) regulator YlbF (YheA/YmcA/DUF963 family)